MILKWGSCGFSDFPHNFAVFMYKTCERLSWQKVFGVFVDFQETKFCAGISASQTPPCFTNIAQIFWHSCAVLLQIIVGEKNKGALPPRGEGKLCPGRSQGTELGCPGMVTSMWQLGGECWVDLLWIITGKKESPCEWSEGSSFSSLYTGSVWRLSRLHLLLCLSLGVQSRAAPRWLWADLDWNVDFPQCTGCQCFCWNFRSSIFGDFYPKVTGSGVKAFLRLSSFLRKASKQLMCKKVLKTCLNKGILT